MAKLTENDRSYEFQYEPGVIIQYDATQTGKDREDVTIDGFDIVVKSTGWAEHCQTVGALDEWHNDDSVFIECCIEDFKKNHYLDLRDEPNPYDERSW